MDGGETRERSLRQARVAVWGESESIAALRAASHELGRGPTRKEYKALASARGWPSVTVISGRWQAVLRTADLTPPPAWTRERVISALKRTPSAADSRRGRSTGRADPRGIHRRDRAGALRRLMERRARRGRAAGEIRARLDTPASDRRAPRRHAGARPSAGPRTGFTPRRGDRPWGGAQPTSARGTPVYEHPGSRSHTRSASGRARPCLTRCGAWSASSAGRPPQASSTDHRDPATRRRRSSHASSAAGRKPAGSWAGRQHRPTTATRPTDSGR